MRESRDRAGLTLEAIVRGARFGAPGGKNLHRDKAIESGVPGLVDLTHAAGPEWRQNQVGTEALTGG
jgi:hypothetical protein